MLHGFEATDHRFDAGAHLLVLLQQAGPVVRETLVTLTKRTILFLQLFDAGKIKNDLGWTPRRDFATGLEITVRWYLDNPRWVERVTSGVYQRQRLGLMEGNRT